MCLPPEPALLCCSGEVHGQLSILLQLVRGKTRSPTVMTLGSALPTAAVANSEREASPPYPGYLPAKEWQRPPYWGWLTFVPTTRVISAVLPGSTLQNTAAGESGNSFSEHYRQQGARTVLHSLWRFMWSPEAALTRDAPYSLVVI